MGKIACMFAGQAAQHGGMGKDLYQEYEETRELFQISSDIFGEDLAALAFKRPFSWLTKTHYVQILITILNVLCYRLSVKWIKPDVVLGFSVGEASALYAANVMNLEDTLRFITLRGKSMQQAALKHAGCMYVVFDMEDSELQEIIDEVRGDAILNISNYNSPGQTIIAGDVHAVEEAVDMINRRNIKTRNLKQQGAWHSMHMADASKKCSEFLENVKLNRPQIPVLFNVSADFESDPEKIRQNMIQHIVEPVKWKQSLTMLKEYGFDTFYEIGPGKILRGLLLSTFRSFKDIEYTVFNLNSTTTIKKLENALALERH